MSKFEFKNLTRTDLLQYDGEKFINVPVYSIRDKVRWEKEEIEQANLRINNNVKTVALVGHKHQISDIENLQNILNTIEGSNWSSLVDISTFNNHVNNLGANKHLTQEQINILFSRSGITSSWGTTSNNYSILSVDNIEKTVALQGHLHEISDVSGLSSALDNKANSSHTHSQYALSSHTHSQYALNSELNNYLLLSGGTLTGTLTLPTLVANTNVSTPKVTVGSNWTIELSGTELLFKYNNVTKQRMFQDGSFSATGELSAYSQGTAADELQLNKLTLLQGGGISKYLSSTATQVYFDIDGATPLSMTKTEVRRGTSDNNVSLGTSVYPWANIYGVNLIALTDISTPKITLGNGWTIEQTSASLTIRRNGVVKGTFDA